MKLSQYNPILFNFTRFIKLAWDYRIYYTCDINNWAFSYPSFWANSNITIPHLSETSCAVTLKNTVILSIKSKNILESLQIHTSAAESRFYRFFFEEKIVMAKTLDSQLILKVGVLFFIALDAIFLIFIVDYSIFLQPLADLCLGCSSQHFLIRWRSLLERHKRLLHAGNTELSEFRQGHLLEWQKTGIFEA